MSFERPQVRTKENPNFPNIEEREIFAGKAKGFIFGKNESLGNLGWSLRNLQTTEDGVKPENEKLVILIREFAKFHNIHKIYAPTPSEINGKIGRRGDFDKVIDLSFAGYDLSLLRGPKADAVEIKSGEAFMMTSADCSTVAATDGEKFLIGHGGRDSFGTPKDPRRPSLVENMVNFFGEDKIKDLKAWGGFTILPGKHFDHQENSETNQDWNRLNRLRRLAWQKLVGPETYKAEGGEFHLDILGVIFAYFKKFGLKEENLEMDSSFCTYNDKNKKGENKWYSNRRQAHEKSGEELARNAVFVLVK